MATLTANGGALVQVTTQDLRPNGEIWTHHRALCANGRILERWKSSSVQGGPPSKWNWKLVAWMDPKHEVNEALALRWLEAHKAKGWFKEEPRKVEAKP